MLVIGIDEGMANNVIHEMIIIAVTYLIIKNIPRILVLTINWIKLTKTKTTAVIK